MWCGAALFDFSGRQRTLVSFKLILPVFHSRSAKTPFSIRCISTGSLHAGDCLLFLAVLGKGCHSRYRSKNHPVSLKKPDIRPGRVPAPFAPGRGMVGELPGTAAIFPGKAGNDRHVKRCSRRASFHGFFAVQRFTPARPHAPGFPGGPPAGFARLHHGRQHIPAQAGHHRRFPW